MAETLEGALIYVRASKVVLTLAMLFYTSALDIRYREVDPKLWAYFGAPITLLGALEARRLAMVGSEEVLLAWALSVAVVVGTFALLYRYGMVGGGDLFALAVISASHQVNPLHAGYYPFPLLVALYLSLPLLCFTLSILFTNVLFFRKELSRVPRRLRPYYLFTAVPRKVDSIRSSRYWFLLELPVCDGKGCNMRYRRTFGIEEDYRYHQRLLEELLAKGFIRGDDRLWATYGLPLLVFVSIGYVLALLLDVTALELFLKALSGIAASLFGVRL